ncbi:hydrolase [Nocardioides anomalus]|uniref:Hydrolase n=1 Tax=Nocardioides anomalus TaxID=2712223 RepID=A0A6G6WCF5_9ACTN|nr:glycosyl hydrolase family 18 protein [Nocardioides anomalus]QIG42899.1 hydrolase [Nocardioides anomalus]
MSVVRAVLLTVLLALLALVAPPAGAVEPLHSTGYVYGDAPESLIARDGHAFSTLGVDGVTLSPRGTRVSTTDGRMAALAHTHGLRAELLVSNYSDRLGDFDPRAGARLLRDPAHVEAVAGQLATAAAAQGWDGIQVDLESLRRGDADGLLALVTRLQQLLPAEKTVSIAVMASDRAEEYVARGYRLAELGAAVDSLALMTYDQHGPWSGPGPVGALPWQRRAVAVVTTVVPAAKVDLGVAGYGYTWPGGRTVSPKQARQLVARDGATARWRDGAGEWTARLSDGTRLWWSDARSVALRQELAGDLGLHGIALWRLGSADPLR